MGVLTHSATTRIAVTVTFLKQTRPCSDPPQPLPANTTLVRLPHPTASFYRYLYDTVGGPYVWWLRRTLPVGELRALLAMPGVSVHVLYRDQEPAGFFELDHQSSAVVNLSYFGLLPARRRHWPWHPTPARCPGHRLVAPPESRDGEHLHRGPSSRHADLSTPRLYARSDGPGDLGRA